MEIVFDSEMKMYSVKDLGSQNGTFVNKVRLSEVCAGFTFIHA
jgi:pSer/pThr/pTyr-binding forkhead associated (FHA) protein